MSNTGYYIARGLNEAPARGTGLTVLHADKPYMEEPLTPRYLIRCREYALTHGVYLIPSRFVLRGFLCLCLLSPKGELIGIQRATHLNLSMTEIRKRTSNIEVFDTGVGRIFLAVDTDIYHPELLRAAKRMGAQVVVSSQYISAFEYSSRHLLRGAYNAAQSNGLYVINTNGSTCSIAAPRQATPDQSGYLLPPEAAHSAGAAFDAGLADSFTAFYPAPDFPDFALSGRYFHKLSY